MRWSWLTALLLIACSPTSEHSNGSAAEVPVPYYPDNDAEHVENLQRGGVPVAALPAPVSTGAIHTLTISGRDVEVEDGPDGPVVEFEHDGYTVRGKVSQETLDDLESTAPPALLGGGYDVLDDLADAVDQARVAEPE